MRLLALAILALIWMTPQSSTAAMLELRDSTLELRLFGDPRSPTAFPAIASAQSTPIFVSVDSSGGFALPSQIFPLTGSIPKSLFTGIPLVSTVNFTGNNAGGVLGPGLGSGSGFGGVAPLTGTAVVGVLGGLLDVLIPLSPWGSDVTGRGRFAIGTFSVQIFLDGEAWTTGRAAVTGVTSSTDGGRFLNTITLTGSDRRSAGHAGSLLLVTPVRILTNVVGNRSGFAIANLNFVPEPGSVLLLGAALVSLLAGIARRRPPR